MSSTWGSCKRILCIRADNIGDVIMSGPAFRALKETFQCHITLLTSDAGAGIAPCMPAIDAVLTADLPWVKNNTQFAAADCIELVKKVASLQFDAAIVLTVYSQSALPSAMLAFLAGIPLRLAYCRENPYGLLTNWVPDKEPYSLIRHQVERDLLLVRSIGATTTDDRLRLQQGGNDVFNSTQQILQGVGVDIYSDYILLHPGVSELKRLYPKSYWQQIITLLYGKFKSQLLISGGNNEVELAASFITGVTDAQVHVVAGLLNLPQFITCVQHSNLVITVNTATTHIAAATQTPQVVLYAVTNPQHTPWKSPSSVLYFPISAALASKNEIIQQVNRTWDHGAREYPSPLKVLQAATALYSNEKMHAVSGSPGS